jgi:AcrR family transcriptional regulator
MLKEARLATRIPARASAMRKNPQQARSKATIDAIVDAAAHILGERGWQGLTTNAAAQVAGVSIGSLYQYFPNKIALVEAVRRRHFDDVLAAFDIAANEDIPRKRRIESFVTGLIAAHGRYPAAHRVLLEEAPWGEDAPRDRFATQYRRACTEFFRLNARAYSDAAVPIAAQMLASAIAGAIHDAAQTGTLFSPILRRELIALVSAYLSRRTRL